MSRNGISNCQCDACERNRIKVMNAYYTKRGRLDMLQPLPKSNMMDCDCYRCAKNRRYIRDTPEIRDDFKPHGPGRYDWDRTTEKDYEHESGRPKE